MVFEVVTDFDEGMNYKNMENVVLFLIENVVL